MSRNTIPLERWFALAADTRLVGRWQVLGLALLCMVLLFPDSAAAGKPAPPSGWTAVTLNTDSNIESHTADINDAGDVVGELRSTSGRFAVLWEVTGRTVTQHLLAGGTRASGVNELQQVVGDSGGDAAYWESVSSPAVILPPVAGDGGASARDLNDDGVIVGTSYGSDAPVAWRVVNEQVTGFLLLPGGPGDAWDLTNNDTDGVATIVGNANFRPVTWQVASNSDGSLALVSGPHDVDLEAVGGGRGQGINALGDVCGAFQFTGSTEGRSAVRAWNGGSLVILGQLNQRQPDDINWAVSINDAGQAVGWDYSKKTSYNGVLWAPNGSATQLVKLITGWYSIREAMGINNQGVIAAHGQLAPFGAWHALIMIPPQ